MRIGIDARELSGHPTGVGRYLAGLLRGWSISDDARRHEFLLYAPGAIDLPEIGQRFATRTVAGAGGTLWEQRALPAAMAGDRLDVFFSPGYTAPLTTTVPTVVAIHDLSFVAHPEWFTLREGWRRRTITRLAARRARAVVTISAFSRGEIVERLALPPAKVHVIPPGVDRPVRDESDHAEVAGRGSAPVLFVGSIFNRRHVPDLIAAVTRMARAHEEIRLDLVGDNRSYPHQDIDHLIGRSGLGNRLTWHRYVSETELAQLYARARAFAFLSEYEGLGLTPLEALSVGVPPVLLDTPVAHESCGNAALYVPRGQVGAIAAALETLLFDESARTGLLAAAPQVLRRYDWTTAAARTLTTIEDAAA